MPERPSINSNLLCSGLSEFEFEYERVSVRSLVKIKLIRIRNRTAPLLQNESNTVNIGCQLSVGNTGVDLPSLISFDRFFCATCVDR